MKTNTFQLFQKLHDIELKELKQAVKDFGGEIHFGLDYVGEDGSGTERPIIAVNRSHGEGPEDVYVNACCIKSGHLEILAETKESGDTFILRSDDIEFGHVSFITDLIPAVNPHKARTIWMRLGVSVTLEKDEMELLLETGNSKRILLEAFKKGQVEIDGNSYIPGSCIEEYNKEYGTDYREEDLDFEF